jgi:hypothetical protein
MLVFLVLHQDIWWWWQSRLFLGLPIGLTYHVLYCFAAALLLHLVIRYNWHGTSEHDEHGAEGTP